MFVDFLLSMFFLETVELTDLNEVGEEESNVGERRTSATMTATPFTSNQAELSTASGTSSPTTRLLKSSFPFVSGEIDQGDVFYDIRDDSLPSWKEETESEITSLERSLRKLSFLSERSESQEKLVQDYREHWNSSN